MRRTIVAACSIALAVVAAGAAPARVSSPEDIALLRTILAESNAYDAKWLTSYSARYKGRSETKDANGDMLAIQTREGIAIVSGDFVSTQDVIDETVWTDGEPQDAPHIHSHEITDGEIVVSQIHVQTDGAPYVRKNAKGEIIGEGVSGPMILEPNTRIRVDRRGLRGGVETPMLWMSLGENWRVHSPGAPLDELLDGAWVESTLVGVGHGGGDVTKRTQLSGLSVRAETVDGEATHRIQFTITEEAHGRSHSTTVTYVLAADKAHRPVEMSRIRDGKPTTLTVDKLTVGRSAEGVWYPTRVERLPFAHARASLYPGVPPPGGIGSQTRVAEFSEFTLNPVVPEASLAAIPPKGSAARAALYTEATGEARTRPPD